MRVGGPKIGIPGSGGNAIPPPPSGWTARIRPDRADITFNGGDVNAIVDKTGNYTFSEATASQQPLWVESDPIFGGRSSMDFDSAASQELALSSGSEADWRLDAAGARTIVVVYSLTSDTSANQTLISKWDSPTAREWLLRGVVPSVSVNRFTVRDSADTGTFSVDSLTDPLTNLNTAHLSVVTHDGVANQIQHYWGSDAVQTTGSVTERTDTAVPTIGNDPGGSTSLDGRIAEIIYYQSALTAAQVAEVKTYVNKYYLTAFT